MQLQDTIYLKDPYGAKYQYFILKNVKKWSHGLKYLKDFIECSNNMQDVYKNIEEYNPSRKCNVLIVFDDMIDDMLSNKKLNPVVTELFITGRKLSISLVFIIQPHFAVPNSNRIDSTQ